MTEMTDDIQPDWKSIALALQVALVNADERAKRARLAFDEAAIKHMVDRFLGWRLPENFRPDCGIRFDADAAKKLNPRNARYEPVGTNLLDAIQAEAMVRHMVEGLTASNDHDR